MASNADIRCDDGEDKAMHIIVVDLPLSTKICSY
jgi:hypothetical protein